MPDYTLSDSPLQSLIGRMQWVYRPAICPDLIVIAVALYLLLGAVVVRKAKRLPVIAIPEQIHIAFVFFDVVNNLGCCGVTFCQAHNAKRIVR